MGEKTLFQPSIFTKNVSFKVCNHPTNIDDEASTCFFTPHGALNQPAILKNMKKKNDIKRLILKLEVVLKFKDIFIPSNIFKVSSKN